MSVSGKHCGLWGNNGGACWSICLARYVLYCMPSIAYENKADVLQLHLITSSEEQ